MKVLWKLWLALKKVRKSQKLNRAEKIKIRWKLQFDKHTTMFRRTNIIHLTLFSHRGHQRSRVQNTPCWLHHSCIPSSYYNTPRWKCNIIISLENNSSRGMYLNEQNLITISHTLITHITWILYYYYHHNRSAYLHVAGARNQFHRSMTCI